MSKPKLAAIIAGIAVVAAGSAAYAAIPDAGGVIRGCYKKKDGTVRVIDTANGQSCSSGENALSWNQQGPAGPPGPKGDQGDPGPSQAYTGGALVQPIDSSETTVATLSLPSAGAYVVSAKLIAVPADSSDPPTIVQCRLTVGSGLDNSVDFTRGTVSDTSGDDVEASLALMTDWTSANSGGNARVSCSAPNPALAEYIKIAAIKVGSVQSPA